MKKIIFLAFFILLGSSLALAADPIPMPSSDPCWVKGTVSSSDLNVSGLTVEAFLGSTLLKSGTISGAEYSLNSVGANTGDSITLKVYGTTFATFTFQGFCKTGDDPWVVENFTVSKQANGVSCNNNAICTSGICSGSVCAASSNGGNNGGGGGGGGGGGPSGDEGTKLNKTKNVKIPPGVGLIGNLNLQEAIEKVLAKGKMDQNAVTNMMQLSAAISGSFDNNIYFESEKTKSTLRNTMQYNGNKPLKNFVVYQTIPKTFGANAANITVTAPGGIVSVVNADPEYMILYPLVNTGQQLVITYSVASQKQSSVMDSVTTEMYAEGFVEEGTAVTTTIALATTTTRSITTTTMPLLEKKSNSWLWWLIIIIVAFVAVIYFVLNRPKKPEQHEEHHEPEAHHEAETHHHSNYEMDNIDKQLKSLSMGTESMAPSSQGKKKAPQKKAEESFQALGTVRHAKPHEHFITKNGWAFGDIQELHDGLKMMDYDTYKHHANKSKNDFSTWVGNVFDDKELAQMLQDSSNREQVIQTLREYLNR